LRFAQFRCFRIARKWILILRAESHRRRARNQNGARG
jgi:hypothetical protein